MSNGIVKYEQPLPPAEPIVIETKQSRKERVKQAFSEASYEEVPKERVRYIKREEPKEPMPDYSRFGMLDKKTAVKLAKIQKEAQFQHELFEFLKHPVVSVVGATITIEAIKKTDLFNDPLTFGALSTVEAAIIGSGVLNSLAKSGALEAVAEGGKQAGETLLKIAPLLLAAL